MYERIKQLRKYLGLTQQEFASRLGIKRNTIATYESGRNDPIDAVVSLICKEYRVNESWLRTGEGDMFRTVSRDDALTAWVSTALSGESQSFQKRFLQMLSTLSVDDWEVLEKMALKMAGDTEEGG